jgi:hypothetical protein
MTFAGTMLVFTYESYSAPPPVPSKARRPKHTRIAMSSQIENSDLDEISASPQVVFEPPVEIQNEASAISASQDSNGTGADKQVGERPEDLEDKSIVAADAELFPESVAPDQENDEALFSELLKEGKKLVGFVSSTSASAHNSWATISAHNSPVKRKPSTPLESPKRKNLPLGMVSGLSASIPFSLASRSKSSKSPPLSTRATAFVIASPVPFAPTLALLSQTSVSTIRDKTTLRRVRISPKSVDSKGPQMPILVNNGRISLIVHITVNNNE